MNNFVELATPTERISSTLCRLILSIKVFFFWELNLGQFDVLECGSFLQVLDELGDLFAFSLDHILAEPVGERWHGLLEVSDGIFEELFNVLQQEEAAIGEVVLLWHLQSFSNHVVLCEFSSRCVWKLGLELRSEIVAKCSENA